jgi:hypothetical protein
VPYHIYLPVGGVALSGTPAGLEQSAAHDRLGHGDRSRMQRAMPWESGTNGAGRGPCPSVRYELYEHCIVVSVLHNTKSNACKSTNQASSWPQ